MRRPAWVAAAASRSYWTCTTCSGRMTTRPTWDWASSTRGWRCTGGSMHTVSLLNFTVCSRDVSDILVSGKFGPFLFVVSSRLSTSTGNWFDWISEKAGIPPEYAHGGCVLLLSIVVKLSAFWIYKIIKFIFKKFHLVKNNEAGCRSRSRFL